MNLKPGLRAIVQTEYVPLTEREESPIELIEPGLDQIPLYQLVRRAIFRGNETGREVKVLRYSLVKGFAPVAGIEPSNLEERIYAEGSPGDFSSQEYDKVAVAIHSSLEDAAREGRISPESLIAKNTIRNTWLKHSREPTYFPDDWEILGILQQQCPELQPYYSSFRNFSQFRDTISNSRDYYQSLGLETPTPNLFGSYLFFVGARRVEARIATKPTGIGSLKKSTEQRKGSLFTYKDITERVAEYFKERISREYSLGLILDVKKLPEKTAGKKRERPDPNFSRGVYIGKSLPEGSMLNLLDTNDIYKDRMVLDYIFIKWINQLVDKMAKLAWGQQDVPIVRQVAKDEMIAALYHNIHGLADDLEATIKGFDKRIVNMYNYLKINLTQVFDTWLPDELIKVREGNFKRLYRKLEDLNRFMPHELGEITYLLYKDRLTTGTRTEIRERRHRFNKLLERVQTKFGIDLGLSGLLEELYQGIYTMLRRTYREKGVDLSKLSPEVEEEVVRAALRKVLLKGTLKYSEIQSRLERIGLEALIKFFYRDLYIQFNLL